MKFTLRIRTFMICSLILQEELEFAISTNTIVPVIVFSIVEHPSLGTIIEREAEYSKYYYNIHRYHYFHKKYQLMMVNGNTQIAFHY